MRDEQQQAWMAGWFDSEFRAEATPAQAEGTQACQKPQQEDEVRRALMLAVVLMAPLALHTSTADARTSHAIGGCGCVTPKLEHWTLRNIEDTKEAHAVWRRRALDSTNPPSFIAIKDVEDIIPRIHKVAGKTVEQYKSWRDACLGKRWCRSIIACAVAGASTYVTLIAEGHSDAVARNGAEHACYGAFIASLISPAIPHAPVNDYVYARFSP